MKDKQKFKDRQEKVLSYALRNGLEYIHTGILFKDYTLKDNKSENCVYGRVYKKIRENKHTHKQTEIYFIVIFKQHPIRENLILFQKTTNLKVLNMVLKRWEDIKIK